MGDFSLPADYPTVPGSVYDDVKLVKLAREIAMGIKDIPDVLYDNSLTQREFEEILRLPHFDRMLQAGKREWEGLGSTEDRVRVKAGAVLEQYLPELYARLNDRGEPMMAKVKAMELLTKMAGFGDRDLPNTGTPGDKVQVIINLGADTRLEFQKTLPAKVIEHEPATINNPPAPSFEESLDASAYPV
jgi:hypothetical protein